MEDKTENGAIEFTFLTLCCKPIHSQKEIEYLTILLETTQLDQQKLLKLAYAHAVFPLLYKTLYKLFPHHTLIEEIKPYYLAHVQYNMAMTTALSKIVSKFKEANIPVLHLKGPILSQQLYNDIGSRQFGDLDILIKKENLKDVLQLLEEAHYNPEIILQQETREVFFNAVNVLGFHHASSHTRIEVHWELLSKNYAIEWDTSLLWKASQTVSINNHSFNTLTKEHTLLYLCLHGSKHLFERLLWVCDIDRILRTQQNIQWVKVQQEAKSLGIMRMLFIGLSLSHTLFQTPLPTEIKEELLKDRDVEKIVNTIIHFNLYDGFKKKKGYQSFRLLYRMREKQKDKLRFLYSALFSTKFDDFKMVQLPSYLAFFYPIVRLVRLISKYIK